MWKIRKKLGVVDRENWDLHKTLGTDCRKKVSFRGKGLLYQWVIIGRQDGESLLPFHQHQGLYSAFFYNMFDQIGFEQNPIDIDR